jgi:hypothetical protein
MLEYEKDWLINGAEEELGEAEETIEAEAEMAEGTPDESLELTV